MARSAAGHAEQAADALDAFLRNRPEMAPIPQQDPGQGAPAAQTNASEPPPPPRRQTAEPASPAGAPLRLPHTDWLRHRLRVTGPAADVAAFQREAAGAGTIPWQLDLASLEEDWFHRLVQPNGRVLSLAGARMLAGQLREAVERRHALAVAQIGHSRASPLDLHAMVPVPSDILALGPDHPAALVWLWQHWGTTEPLRHVAYDGGGKLPIEEPPVAGQGTARFIFWSADWTPWRAFERIRAAWPKLAFDVRPDYDVN